MRNNQNKHGPDIDVGTRHIRHIARSDTEDAELGPDVGCHEPDVGFQREGKEIPIAIGRRNGDQDYFQVSISDLCGSGHRKRHFDPFYGKVFNQLIAARPRRKKRRQNNIVDRRPGESPPGYVEEINWIYIDSKSQRKRTIRGCHFKGEQTAVLSVMGGLCCKVRSSLRNDKETKGPDSYRDRDEEMICGVRYNSLRKDLETRGLRDEGMIGEQVQSTAILIGAAHRNIDRCSAPQHENCGLRIAESEGQRAWSRGQRADWRSEEQLFTKRHGN